jgi:hypothetical protein
MEVHKLTLKALVTIVKMLIFIMSKMDNVSKLDVKYFERELDGMEKEIEKVR